MKLTRSFALTMILAGLATAQALPPAQPAIPAPTTNPAEVAAAKETLKQYNAAIEAGDTAKLIAAFNADESQLKTLQMMGRIAEARNTVYKAMVEKFGQPLLIETGMTKEALGVVFPILPVDLLEVRIAGEKAVLMAPDGSPMPFSLLKKDGAWKIDTGSQPMSEQQLKEQTTIIEAVLKANSETSEDIKAGHFRTPDEVPILLQHREQKAVEKIRLAQMQQRPASPAEQIPSDLVEPATTPSTAPAGPAAPPTN